MKKVIIIGAGPAGLTAGYDLLSRSKEYDVTIVEENNEVGGICRKYEKNGKILDAGGHFFIARNSQVKNFWNNILPVQGTPSRDDLFLERYCKISNGGPDPEQTDDVLLSREKIMRVLKSGKFYDSPFYLSTDTMKSIGFGNSVKTGLTKVGNTVFKRKEKTLEDYYVNRFGKQLYSLFLEDYLDKVWGRHPSKISAEWGPISERNLIAPTIQTDKKASRDLEKATAPYANRFYYPKYGVSQMWEKTAEKFVEMGGSIHKNCKVLSIRTDDKVVTGIDCMADGDQFFVPCDILISSMPLRAMIGGMQNVPYNVREVAHGLGYRDLVSIGVELTDMGYRNKSDAKTINDILPDSALYINDTKVKLGRLQIFNNFSPYMVGNSDRVWLGLNYYCNEGDYYWNLNDQAWKDLVVSDLMNLGMIKNSDAILDFYKVAVKKAFPGYHDTYERFGEIVEYLNGFGNLYCVGRNGQHRFNTMEQSMLTSFETVKNIITGTKTKDNIWNVNDISDNDDIKSYNSGLLSADVVYTGNAVPIQRTDNIPEDRPRSVEIRRMRRPMMTPIKKAEPPKEEENNNVPIIINDSVVIAARPEKTIPIEVEEENVETTLNDTWNTNGYTYPQNEYEPPVQEETVTAEPEQREYIEPETVVQVIPENSFEAGMVRFSHAESFVEDTYTERIVDKPEADSSPAPAFRTVNSFTQKPEDTEKRIVPNDKPPVIAVEKTPFASLWDEVDNKQRAPQKQDISEVIVPVKTYEEEPVSEETVPERKTETKEPVKDSLSHKTSDYLTKEIDTSIVFKNARVIKTTKISSTASDRYEKAKESEKRTPFISANEKVIAVIKNGEKIPVNDTKETAKPKTTRRKKEQEISAPISMIIEPDTKADTAEPLPAPKKRSRKTKITTEEQ